MVESGKKYIVTVHRFTADDGYQYESVWGKCEIVKLEDVLGFPPTRTDSNFLLKVSGDSGKSIYFPGCSIQSVLEREDPPPLRLSLEDGPPSEKWLRHAAFIYLI